jgi:dihydroorotate dehydrogenase
MPNFYPLMKPFLWRLDAERSHRLALLAVKAAPAWSLPSPGVSVGLETKVWGRVFSNPVGLAAGFDKHAEAVSALYRLGFGFVEVGGVTFWPQTGNSKPRLFRLSEDEAVINRMGLNSVGVDKVALALVDQRRRLLPGPLAVNLGLNKGSNNPPSDYAGLARVLSPLAEVLTINVSSPNTPGLRALQDPRKLMAIVEAVRAAALSAPDTLKPAVLVKIAPDLKQKDIEDICALAIKEGFDGLVVSNTTVDRPETLLSSAQAETGGLSGRPLLSKSTELLREIYSRTEGNVPLVGVGGVSSSADAYEKIRAGASLVQLYSALVFKGPALIGEIKSGLVESLKADGFASIMDAVGADHR